MFTTCVSLVPNSQLTRLRIGAKCILECAFVCVFVCVCVLGAHTYLLFARQKEEKNNNRKSKQENNVATICGIKMLKHINKIK